jgi:hypothetical protein
MSNIVAHLADTGYQFLDAIQHLVEGHRQPIDLFVPRRDRVLFCPGPFPISAGRCG